MRAAAVVLAGVLLTATTAPAAVVCQRKNGVLVVREACRKKERPADLATLGVVGPPGAKGATGAPGTSGAPGSPGPLLATLPSGATLRGAFVAGGIATAMGETSAGVVSFVFPLASNPTVVVVEQGDATPAGCSGNAGAPGADAGHLCVFVGSAAANEAPFQVFGAADGSDDVRFGAYVFALSLGAGPYGGSGTWAVTAP